MSDPRQVHLAIVTRTGAPLDPGPVPVSGFVLIAPGSVPPERAAEVRVRVGGVEVPADVTVLAGSGGGGLRVSFTYPPEGGDVVLVLPPPA